VPIIGTELETFRISGQ